MMVKARPGPAHPTPTDRLMGPLVTATTVLGLNALTNGAFVAHPIALACVVYSVFRGGVGAGLVSSGLIISDALIRIVAVPFGLDEPFRQVNIVALACLVLVLVTGHLKRRADRASELSQANQQLTGQLIERARSEEAALALATMTRDLVEPLDVSRVHDRIVSTILDLFRVRQAMLYQLDTASQELMCVATAGEVDDKRWLGHRLPAEETITGGTVQGSGPRGSSRCGPEAKSSAPSRSAWPRASSPEKPTFSSCRSSPGMPRWRWRTHGSTKSSARRSSSSVDRISGSSTRPDCGD